MEVENEDEEEPVAPGDDPEEVRESPTTVMNDPEW